MQCRKVQVKTEDFAGTGVVPMVSLRWKLDVARVFSSLYKTDWCLHAVTHIGDVAGNLQDAVCMEQVNDGVTKLSCASPQDTHHQEGSDIKDQQLSNVLLQSEGVTGLVSFSAMF
jgi:hypothetical protein